MTIPFDVRSFARGLDEMTACARENANRTARRTDTLDQVIHQEMSVVSKCEAVRAAMKLARDAETRLALELMRHRRPVDGGPLFSPPPVPGPVTQRLMEKIRK